MSNKPPVSAIVIQFADFDDFLDELRERIIFPHAVRVWRGNGRFGGSSTSPTTVRQFLNVQFFDPRRYEILTCSILVMEYRTFYSQPFDPKDSIRKEVIQPVGNEVVNRVKAALTDEFVGLNIRPGSIYTGLDVTSIQPASWEALEDLFDFVVKVVDGEAVIDDMPKFGLKETDSKDE
jgi:hypothetical protein